MSSFTAFSPAKINLFLAVTGRRPDGFHDLVSVVAPLAWGDELRFEPAGEGASFCLQSDAQGLPLDESNLVLRAAKAFAAASSWRCGGSFHLTKRIPVGAGLGGGSSNAAAALRLLNDAAGAPLDAKAMAGLAAGLGSDCPLFLADGPVIMRGRGERLSSLVDVAARRLKGRRVLVFKPAFGISTPWAYGRMVAAAPSLYLPADLAEDRLNLWIEGDDSPEKSLLFNNMESVAFEKFLALPTLLDRLASAFALAPRMSGSGSACFCLLPETFDASPVIEEVKRAWGSASFSCVTRIA